jgi:hypothetical protein
MRNRLALAGITIEAQAFRGAVIRRMSWGYVGNEKPNIPDDKKQCPYCQILILIDQHHCLFCEQDLLNFINKKEFIHESNASVLH